MSDYHSIIIQPAIIQFDEGAVKTPSIEVLAMRGDQKEPDDQPKRGRGRK